MTPIKLTLPFFDLKYDKIKEPICHYVELYPAHLIYDFQCYMDKHPSPDDVDNFTVREDVYENNSDFILKKSIANTNSYWSSGSEIWKYDIHLTSGQYLSFKFQDESEMRKVESLVNKWLLL